MPAHHKAAEYLDAYLELARLKEAPDAALWQSIPMRSARKRRGSSSRKKN